MVGCQTLLNEVLVGEAQVPERLSADQKTAPLSAVGHERVRRGCDRKLSETRVECSFFSLQWDRIGGEGIDGFAMGILRKILFVGLWVCLWCSLE